eukprot:SAG11_NODE_26363_length_346_cov_0.821862_1_plen_59_part_01
MTQAVYGAKLQADRLHDRHRRPRGAFGAFARRHVEQLFGWHPHPSGEAWGEVRSSGSRP